MDDLDLYESDASKLEGSNLDDSRLDGSRLEEEPRIDDIEVYEVSDGSEGSIEEIFPVKTSYRKLLLFLY